MAGGFVQPLAAWRVTLDGEDLTPKMNPRLVSVRLSEKRGEAADELEIVLTDHDGKLALPPEGAVLKLELGWQRGTGVAIGLVAKGSFKVADISWDGPPDKISITARSADLKDSFRTRKTKVWKDTMLGEITGAIAGENGLTARCHPDLYDQIVTVAEQHAKSDMQFMRDLGRRYDAVATVKDGSLIFAPVNATTTATGKDIPTITLTRSSGDKASWRRAAREGAQDGAEAQYQDTDEATRKSATSGGSSNRRRMKRVYASQDDAEAASTAESNRLQRAAASFDLALAYGDAAIAPGMRAAASGFKAEIDAAEWLITEVEHSMEASGLRTTLKMEAAPAPN